MATEIEAKAICTLTNSGYTAYQISAWRPDSLFLYLRQIVGFWPSSICYGGKCHYYDRFVSTDETVVDVNLIAKEKGYVKTGDSLVNLLAMPVANKGMVNTLRVSVIED